MFAPLLQLSLLTLFLITPAASELGDKKYFFIYDWPMPLRDVYPPPGAELHPTASYDHEFYENDGFGKTLNREMGLFSTWQFSLFKNLMARLRVSEHRTLDSTKASTFIIPYDMGVHSFIGGSFICFVPAFFNPLIFLFTLILSLLISFVNF
jgi:hypothetical protein